MQFAIVLLIILLATLVGAFGALYLKRGAGKFSFHPLRLLRNWEFILGGVLYVIGFLIYLFVLPTTPLSIAYPLTSMSYVWVTILSYYFLGEKVDAWRWAGIGYIIIGIILLTL